MARMKLFLFLDSKWNTSNLALIIRLSIIKDKPTSRWKKASLGEDEDSPLLFAPGTTSLRSVGTKCFAFLGISKHRGAIE